MPALIEDVIHEGLPAVALTSADGARALISRFGAQVLSWQPARGEERLYLSENARFDGKTPIRGGIPVCFPQFGELGKLARHGFARTAEWTVCDRRTSPDCTLVTLGWTDDEYSLAWWPHSFDAELTVALCGQRLDVEFGVTNTGHAPFAFTAALHTYVRVREVENARLEGLYGHSYQDAGNEQKGRRDSGDAVVIDGPMDRIYADVERPLLLHDSGRVLRIESEGFPDVVVWNPWEAACAQLPDMPKSGFRHMLCIEAAAARHRIELDADQTWFGRQTLVAL